MKLRQYTPFRFILSTVLFVFGMSLTFCAQAQSLNTKQLETQIKAGMMDWNIPGLAIAIVKDDQVIYSRGFGEKKLGSGEMVDDNTMFGIASVSKNITAAALALLVDEGKL